jgi:HEAT repeat protein
MHDVAQVNSAQAKLKFGQPSTAQRDWTMSKLFVAGLVSGLSFLVAVAMADDQKTKDLIKGLAGGNEAARLRAIDSLGEEGEISPEAVDALAAQLKDRSPTIRAHAAHALSHFGPAARSAVNALAPLIVDPEVNVQREAIRAWTRIHPAASVSVPVLEKTLRDADPAVRTGALHLLAEIGKPAVPSLIQALKQEKAALWACLVLAEIGPDAADAVPALADAVRADTRPEIRREAALALGAIGPASAKAVRVLTERLVDADSSVSSSAAYALGRIGPEAKAAVPALRKGVESSDPFVQTISAWSLAKIEPQDPARRDIALKLLTAGLRSNQTRLRAAAARGLADLHPAPEAILPAIVEVLEGGDRESAGQALEVLAALGEAGVPALTGALKREEIRPTVATILGHIGPPAKKAVPALAEIIKSDKNVRARCESLIALGAIGAEAAEAVPAVIQALNDPQEKVSYSACYALGRIGPTAIGAKLELQKKLTDPDEFVALAAAWALAQIDPQCSQVAAVSVPVLIKGLTYPEPKIRREAALSLRSLGPLAKAAVPALKTAVNDPDEAVRDTATAALKAIGQ